MRGQGLLRTTQQENEDIILSMVEQNNNGKILDCGCGNGSFTKQLAERAGTTQVYGVEFIEESAKAAENKGIEVYRANLNEGLPMIKDNTFDLVHANQVIEHLFETDLFIREVYRVLKSGGYAIISTPNLASLHGIVSLLLGKQPFTAHISNEVILGNSLNPRHREKHYHRGSPHLRIFTYEALKHLFEYYGFEGEKLVGVGYYPFPIKIARFLCSLDKRHAVCLTMKVRKPGNRD